MVICLERDADLHMAQLMPLPLTVSCFSKIQIGFTFLVRLSWVAPEKCRLTVVRVCVVYNTRRFHCSRAGEKCKLHKRPTTLETEHTRLLLRDESELHNNSNNNTYTTHCTYREIIYINTLLSDISIYYKNLFSIRRQHTKHAGISIQLNVIHHCSHSMTRINYCFLCSHENQFKQVSITLCC